MLVVPHQWTHHHHHRLFHLTQSIIFSVILVTVLFTGTSIWFSVQANPVSGDVTLAAQVGILEPEPPPLPAVILLPSQPEPKPESIPLPGPMNIYAEPRGKIPREVRVTENQSNIYYVFPTQYPQFSGDGLPSGTLVILETRSSDAIVRHTIFTDQSGKWYWRSPQPLGEGPYRLDATAIDPLTGKAFGYGSADFWVDLPGTPGSGTPRPIPPRSPTGIGGYLSLYIQTQSKILFPGNRIVAILEPHNIPNGTYKFSYELRTLYEGKIIYSYSESETLTGPTTFTKAFRTNLATVPGQYELLVTVTATGASLWGSDTFRVLTSPVYTGFTGMDINLIRLLQIFGLFAIAVFLVAYYHFIKARQHHRIIKVRRRIAW